MILMSVPVRLQVETIKKRILAYRCKQQSQTKFAL